MLDFGMWSLLLAMVVTLIIWVKNLVALIKAYLEGSGTNGKFYLEMILSIAIEIICASMSFRMKEYSVMASFILLGVALIVVTVALAYRDGYIGR